MAFTPQELAEMVAADAEIEAEFRLTPEDLELSRELDREGRLQGLSPENRKLAAYQKAYYEANREKRIAYQKAYNEANREKQIAYQKAYYEANREKRIAYQKAYRAKKRSVDGAGTPGGGDSMVTPGQKEPHGSGKSRRASRADARPRKHC